MLASIVCVTRRSPGDQHQFIIGINKLMEYGGRSKPAPSQKPSRRASERARAGRHLATKVGGTFCQVCTPPIDLVRRVKQDQQ